MPKDKELLGLGIESSCDETALALVKDGKYCLANIIASQTEKHAPFQGVVPELASRAHLEKINFVYEEALEKAGVSLKEIDYIALTVQPGLVGSLMIGGAFAKSLAMVTGLSVVRVDHVEAHLYAPCLENWKPHYPFLGLLLSGANSAIYEVRAPGKLKVLADTMDDACGEAFDKVGSVLGLNKSYSGKSHPDKSRPVKSYLGGPVIEKKAIEYEQSHAKNKKKPEPLFQPLLKKRRAREIVFSFSGIKTAVIHAHSKGFGAARICYDFQNTVFELVERNLLKAIKKTGISNIVAGGGVLANESLRKRLSKLAKKEGCDLRYPQNKNYCTDNAAMVAALGYFLRNTPWETKRLDFEVDSRRSNLLYDNGFMA